MHLSHPGRRTIVLLIRIYCRRCNGCLESGRVDLEFDVPTVTRHFDNKGVRGQIMGDHLYGCATKVVVNEVRRVVRLTESVTHAFSCKEASAGALGDRLISRETKVVLHSTYAGLDGVRHE